MTESTKSQSTTKTASTVKSINKVTFNELHEVGCYVVEPTGDLMRFPELTADHRPHYHVVSNGTLWLTKISDDPFLAINYARMIAADQSLPVNF